MAEPKKRLTSTRSGNRQSKDALKATSLNTCSNCKEKVQHHRVCSNCGFYKGEKVLKMQSEIIKSKKVEEQIKEESNE